MQAKARSTRTSQQATREAGGRGGGRRGARSRSRNWDKAKLRARSMTVCMERTSALNATLAGCHEVQTLQKSCGGLSSGGGHQVAASKRQAIQARGLLKCGDSREKEASRWSVPFDITVSLFAATPPCPCRKANEGEGCPRDLQTWSLCQLRCPPRRRWTGPRGRG